MVCQRLSMARTYYKKLHRAIFIEKEKNLWNVTSRRKKQKRDIAIRLREKIQQITVHNYIYRLICNTYICAHFMVRIGIRSCDTLILSKNVNECAAVESN